MPYQGMSINTDAALCGIVIGAALLGAIPPSAIGTYMPKKKPPAQMPLAVFT